MDTKKLENLYKGQEYEYRTISDLYKIGYDAFKAPIDYGIDVIGVPKPFSNSKLLILNNEKIARVLLIQTKSIEITNKKKTYIVNDKNVNSSDYITIQNIDLCNCIENMDKYKNVSIYLIIYVKIPDDMKEFIFGNNQDMRIVNKELKFVLSLADLIDLQSSNYLSPTDNGDKYDMCIRIQGKSNDYDKHSFQFWIHSNDKEQATPVLENDLGPLSNLVESNLDNNFRDVNYHADWLKDYLDNDDSSKKEK